MVFKKIVKEKITQTFDGFLFDGIFSCSFFSIILDDFF